MKYNRTFNETKGCNRVKARHIFIISKTIPNNVILFIYFRFENWQSSAKETYSTQHKQVLREFIENEGEQIILNKTKNWPYHPFFIDKPKQTITTNILLCPKIFISQS